MHLSADNQQLIDASQIEEQIFGENNYIENNTFITSHDTINFFESYKWKYYIKRSSTAIDFQLNI